MEQWVATLIAAVAGPVLTVALAWKVGQALTLRSDRLKRQADLDLDAVHQLYKNYAEAVVVARRWRQLAERDGPNRRADDRNEPSPLSAGPGGPTRAELLRDAEAVEEGMEALLVKIAAERALDTDGLATLGAFRAGLQQLRKGIRDNEQRHWSTSTPDDYLRFRALAAVAASLVAAGGASRSADKGAAQALFALQRITEHANEERWRETADKLLASGNTKALPALEPQDAG